MRGRVVHEHEEYMGGIRLRLISCQLYLTKVNTIKFQYIERILIIHLEFIIKKSNLSRGRAVKEHE